MYLSLLALIVFASTLQAQDFDHYQLQHAQGEVPEDLRLSSSQKYERDAAKIDARGRAAKKQGTFLLQSNFLLDELLLSGRVLFNDPVSQFVTQVKDKLLKNQPELQKSIKTYVVKSPIANAFATNGGILLVNMGLIARLHTEAELAFVLAHEIQHYLKKHPMNVYVKSEELKRDKKMLGLDTQEDYMMAKTKYSRDIEQEADLLGLELYLQSGYSLDAAISIFDVLSMSSYPFDQREWNYEVFETDFLVFPASYAKWPIDTLQPKEDEADSLCSHPNTAKRRAAIQARLAELGNKEGEHFLVGPMEFLNVRKICRFEMCEMYLQQRALEAAYYNAYLAQQEEPDSYFLKKTIARALYGMATYRSQGKFIEYHLEAKDCEGERQQVQHFWESLNPAELHLLAIRTCWQLHMAEPGDSSIALMSRDLIRLFIAEHRKEAASMIKEQPSGLPRQFVELKRNNHAERDRLRSEAGRQVVDEKEMGGLRAKLDSLVIEKEADEESEEEENEEDTLANLPWALMDLFQDQEFKLLWDSENKPAKDPSEEFVANKKAARQKRRGGVPFGLEKVVFVQPIYKQLDLRKEVPMKYLESEKSLDDHKKMISKIAEDCGLEYAFLETSHLNANETDKFNDAAAAAECFHEILENQDQGIDMLSLKSEDGRMLAEKYGTPYFVWTGVVTALVPKAPTYKLTLIMITLFTPMLSPLSVFFLIKPIHRTYLVTYLIDIEKGKIERENMREFYYAYRQLCQ
ncbi:MAG: hypothetical protein RLZZ519_919 [Bacteroidota bacterium]|jgi:hypothetical protein